ncbi:MAG: hypothetical protein M0Z40_18300 [Actinomycetota bacterium]|nr:hypothetical protein [Actinomycetota bacterium]
MPDEPTPTAGSRPPEGAASEPDATSGSAPAPEDDRYHWHGPSSPPFPGAQRAEGTEGQPPDGTPYWPYQTPRRPYGQTQGPYGQAQGPYPYGHTPASPYGPPPFPSYPWAYPPPPPPPPRAPRSPEERRRRTRRGLAFAGVLILAVGAGIGIGASIAPTSPSAIAKSLVNRAIAQVTHAGTYHYVERSTAFGAQDNIAGDAAPDGGRQVILQHCSGGTTYFHLRLVRGIVYFKGTRVAVVDQLGVPAARAAAVTGRWVKVVKGDKLYAGFADGITTKSNISELRTAIIPTASRALPNSSPPSTEVLGALFKTSKHHRTIGTASLVLDTSSGLPHSLRGTATSASGSHYTLAWSFGRYGEKVDVAAPTASVPYASLHATPPAKSTCS